MMNLNDYVFHKSHGPCVGLSPFYNKLLSCLKEDAPIFTEGDLDDILPGPNLKTAYAHFESDSWYVLDFADWNAYQVFPKLSRSFEQKVTPELFEAFAAWIIIQGTMTPSQPNGDGPLTDLMLKHMRTIGWIDGLPTKVFNKRGYPCIQYASGRWWYYDLDSMTWF